MIYIVEDDKLLCDSVAEFLRHCGHDLQTFLNAEDALAAATKAPPDLAICDLNLPGMGGLELLEKLKEVDEAIVRIAVTAHASTRSAVRAMRSGCYEYLEKPVDLQQLNRLVARALDAQRDRRELAWLRQAEHGQPGQGGLLGESPSMVTLRANIASFAKLDAGAPPILFLGETGVGKGLAARTLHEQRFGADAPWISVNCAALPNSLVEAELFGYERSAFTDAKQAKAGLFEAASGGTIFLDEIGEFSLEVQAKLLTMIESRKVRRIGSLHERPIHCAISAASNVDLQARSADGGFRLDLYHRLAGLRIVVPPLRERGDDVTILAKSFAAEFSNRYANHLRGISPEALARILNYSWPGNIRELRAAIERAAILARPDETMLGAEHLPQPDASVSPAVSTVATQAASIRVGSDGVHVELPAEGIAFDDIERAVLQAALAQADGNVSGAARLLQLNRDAMRYRIRKLDIDE
jgi:DNA-binding NtrC family response regulator